MVFVTGGNGFTGSWLICTLLKAGIKVKAMHRSGSSLQLFQCIHQVFFGNEGPHPQWVQCDLSDFITLEEHLKDSDAVFHTAALVSFHFKDRKNLWNSNVIGTGTPINSMLHTGVKKLIYISSTASIGENPTGISDENTEWDGPEGKSYYALTKHKAENEVWRGQAEGLEVAVINPGIILGFGNWNKGSAATFKKIYKGLAFYTQGSNGFTDVRDVADLALHFYRHNLYGKRYLIIGSNQKYKYIFSLMARHFNQKPPYIGVSNKLLNAVLPFIYLYEWLFPRAFITSETVRAAKKNISYNTKRLQDEVGFQCRKIEDTIEFSCQLYLNNTIIS